MHYNNTSDKIVTIVLILLSLLIVLVLGRIIYILHGVADTEEIPEIVTLRKEVAELDFPEKRKELPYLRKIGNNNIDILEVVRDYNKYPEELTAFLCANPAQLNFVKNYKNNICIYFN